MITSEQNRAWPGDVPLGDGYSAAGLPAPSRIRTLKIATIETSRAEYLGSVSAEVFSEVRLSLQQHLALS
jgi:mRNA interferase MazF